MQLLRSCQFGNGNSHAVNYFWCILTDLVNLTTTVGYSMLAIDTVVSGFLV